MINVEHYNGSQHATIHIKDFIISAGSVKVHLVGVVDVHQLPVDDLAFPACIAHQHAKGIEISPA